MEDHESAVEDPAVHHPTAQHHRTSLIAGAVSIFVALAFLWWVGGGSDLLHRTLWMDEVHSWLLITDPDVDHALAALADGADYNPPGYYLVARGLAWLPGGVTEFRLRVLSLGFTGLGLLGLSVMLSRCFRPLPCTAAVVATAGHTLLIHQATEIRFYTLWFCALVWMCVLTDSLWKRSAANSVSGPTGSRRVVGCAAFLTILLLAALISSCHYFGIISVALVVAGRVATDRSRRSVQHGAVILLAGLCAVGLFAGMLRSQRAALSRPTWISAPTIEGSLTFLMETTPALVTAVLIACTVAYRFGRWPADGLTIATLSRIRQMSVAPLMLLPVVLVAFSWLVQPSLVARYATVGLLGFAPLIAGLTSVQRAGIQRMCFAGAVSLGAWNLSQCVLQWREFDAGGDKLLDSVRLMQLELPPGAPIIFEDRIAWMPLIQRHPELSSCCYLADFEPDQLDRDSTLRIVQRDVGRRLARWYPQYHMRAVSELRALSAFGVVTYRGGSADDLRYPPGFTAYRLAADCFLFRANGREQHSQVSRKAQLRRN